MIVGRGAVRRHRPELERTRAPHCPIAMPQSAAGARGASAGCGRGAGRRRKSRRQCACRPAIVRARRIKRTRIGIDRILRGLFDRRRDAEVDRARIKTIMQAFEVARDIVDLRRGKSLRGRHLCRDQSLHVRIERGIRAVAEGVDAAAGIAVHVGRLHREGGGGAGRRAADHAARGIERQAARQSSAHDRKDIGRSAAGGGDGLTIGMAGDRARQARRVDGQRHRADGYREGARAGIAERIQRPHGERGDPAAGRRAADHAGAAEREARRQGAGQKRERVGRGAPGRRQRLAVRRALRSGRRARWIDGERDGADRHAISMAAGVADAVGRADGEVRNAAARRRAADHTARSTASAPPAARPRSMRMYRARCRQSQ